VLYVPAGNPAPDFEIEVRTGEALYTNSVIALDAATGKMLGYNQLVKNDMHDWDVDSPPTLLTTAAGRPIVASANKDGQLAVLDRSQIVRGKTVTGDLADAMPVIYTMPTTTRENVNTPLSRDRLVRFCPGITGGSEWNGAAYSPKSNAIYVGAVDWCASVQLKRDTTTIPPAGTTWLGNENANPFGPASQARGWLTAFNADSGAVLWKFHAPHPMLAAVTPTAGGLVFAADMSGELYAFDADNGKVLWKTNTGQSTGGGIISYSVAGRQFIAVASGMKSPTWPGGADQSRILVYGL
jgi:alcohol dehydrogenase (cytochrome c)